MEPPNSPVPKRRRKCLKAKQAQANTKLAEVIVCAPTPQVTSPALGNVQSQQNTKRLHNAPALGAVLWFTAPLASNPASRLMSF